ncbi:hypothetical protein FOYG_13775 [Fusarium oxysporum NRRL 32931]|uniref:Uncharacterized protein n=1 Tax=Fusarium oxysporum NRRL 32931 TaxID=660029 RepID=W9HSN3_FUSOX|nr:hypothetical protein FOYG_13775 [Fusarium oxysporum NRRL 32931]
MSWKRSPNGLIPSKQSAMRLCSLMLATLRCPGRLSDCFFKRRLTMSNNMEPWFRTSR